MNSPDVVIVGAGAVGAAAAFELSRAGARVRVLERALDGLGCSHGNAGLISPSHSETLASPASLRSAAGWLARSDSPLRIPARFALAPWLARFVLAAQPARAAAASQVLRALTAASLDLHEQLVGAGLSTSFSRNGILGIHESEKALQVAVERARINGHTEIELLSSAQTREHLPALRSPVAGALLYTREAHCDPGHFVNALLDGARQLGAEVSEGIEVTGIDTNGVRVSALETTSGRMTAGTVVLAAGVWTRALARDAGLALPLEGGKGYHLELPANPSDGLAAFFEDARITATPLNGRLRITGVLDLAGLDATVNRRSLAGIERSARRLLDFPPEVGPIRVWSGLRPCTPDGLPVIGPVPGTENLLVATGHAMLGIALAPATGEIVTDLVAGRASRFAIEPFSPARFRHRWPVMQNAFDHQTPTSDANR